MLYPGDSAPNFELPNADLEMMQSSDFIGKYNIVLYFYPKDDTPGCTLEALDFSDLRDEFDVVDTKILGISCDHCQSHGEFRDKNGLTIRLLADIDRIACQAYDVWREKQAHGEKRMGILRSTFIIDKNGTIQHALYGVKPKGHAAQVLELAKGI